MASDSGSGSAPSLVADKKKGVQASGSGKKKGTGPPKNAPRLRNDVAWEHGVSVDGGNRNI